MVANGLLLVIESPRIACRIAGFTSAAAEADKLDRNNELANKDDMNAVCCKKTMKYTAVLRACQKHKTEPQNTSKK